MLPIWKKRLDAKTRITTPNSDVIYAMIYLDLGKDGPMVFEAPPMLQGILLDFWQRPIPVDGGKFAGDVGLPGPDAGKGGKFLLLPPGYKGKVPKDYYVYRSGTNNVFVFLRAFYQDPKDLSQPVKLMEQAKFYPLGQQASAKPMQYPNASGVPANMLPVSDATVFDQLKRLGDSEGSHLASPDGLGMLASIGISTNQPFNPDAHTRAILDRAAKTAYKMSRVIGFQEELNGGTNRVYPDRRWTNPMDNITPHNARNSISPGMVSKIPGKGAMYIIAFTDSQGVPLSGSAYYHLNLPADIPAANFWSLTLYEAENGSGLANGQPFPSIGSRDKPAQNADGSTDLYLGPKAPAGKQSNWMATVPGKGYFAILRLYGPTETAMDKSWKPGDIEKIQ